MNTAFDDDEVLLLDSIPGLPVPVLRRLLEERRQDTNDDAGVPLQKHTLIVKLILFESTHSVGTVSAVPTTATGAEANVGVNQESPSANFLTKRTETPPRGTGTEQAAYDDVVTPPRQTVGLGTHTSPSGVGDFDIETMDHLMKLYHEREEKMAQAKKDEATVSAAEARIAEDVEATAQWTLKRKVATLTDTWKWEKFEVPSSKPAPDNLPSLQLWSALLLPTLR